MQIEHGIMFDRISDAIKDRFVEDNQTVIIAVLENSVFKYKGDDGFSIIPFSDVDEMAVQGSYTHSKVMPNYIPEIVDELYSIDLVRCRENKEYGLKIDSDMFYNEIKEIKETFGESTEFGI